MKPSYAFSLAIMLCVSQRLHAEKPTPAAPHDDCPQLQTLQQHFDSPVDADKPWAYWWWVNGNVTKESITRDMEELKAKGFGGLLMFDSRNYHDYHLPPPPPPTEYLDPQWRKLLRYSIAEADRLGLRMSINLSRSAGALDGPWSVGDNAPKKLIWTAAEVNGPRSVTCSLAKQEKTWDIAVIAVKHAAADNAPGAASDKVAFAGEWQDMRADVKSGVQVAEVVDVTKKVDEQGVLHWEAPAGRWTLLRFACVIMEGHENDADILSKSAVEEFFNRLGKAFLEEAGDAARKTLTNLYSVSWEGATPTWTFSFEKEFQHYRGYDINGYLPVLAGMIVDSPAVSERFLRDYYRTLSDCFMENCYGNLRELSHKEGLQWHSESGGPWHRNLSSFACADQLAFLARNDMPQGEFWYKYRGLNRPIAMTAHIYGKKLAATEAFTHMTRHWSIYPAVLKPGADAAFVDGINHFIWHTFTASPKEFGKPGIEYFAGSHINPNVTWWEQSGAFLKYLARCQTMLRPGKCVVDVCCYVGDSPYLHWGRAEKWSAKPTLELGKGYTYDLVNTEVLLQRMSVQDGDLVLPDGMRYRVLVVDLEDETASPQVLQRIIELVEAGATVVLGTRRPQEAIGLANWPQSDKQVQSLAGKLWGAASNKALSRKLGEGQVVTGQAPDNVLAARGIAPDFDGPFGYIHRRCDDYELYFLDGEGCADCIFRVDGKAPKLWDPQTGKVREALSYRQTADGRTVVPICLPTDGSVFVVFTKPESAAHITSIEGPADGETANVVQLARRSGQNIDLNIWQAGSYQLKTAAGKQLELSVADIPATKAIGGPWNVQFTKGWGAPEQAVFKKLIPWNEHADDGIRHYSGTATYRNTFELTEAEAKSLVRLNLGEVAVIADVRVNGKSLGVVWAAPWSVCLTDVVHPGKNELEIDVSNLWINRLIGDADLSLDKRVTKTNALRRDETAKRPHLRGYASSEPLEKSGLVGPVMVEFGSRREVSMP